MTENIKEIQGVYEELKGVLSSIPEKTSSFTDEGFTEHVNAVIERLGKTCPEINDWKNYTIQNRLITSAGIRSHYVIDTVLAKSKLNGLIGRIKGTYELDVPSTGSGLTLVQNQSQNQSQSIALMLELHEKILSELPNHLQGTAERSFLEKLKESLPTIKNTMDILSEVLKIGANFGLDCAKIHTLLGL